MSKAERTREFIIEKAAPVFNTKGYAGTSLADVMETTGLTKGSIYGNFENKDALAIAVYKYNVETYGKRLEAYINAETTASDKIIAITKYYRENWKRMAERGGCPMLNASIEADDNLPFLKKEVQESIKKLAQKISNIIEAGIQNGSFKKNISPKEYAYTIITLIEGSIMLFKIENNTRHLFNGLDRILKILKEEIEK
jgi:AcrR family transcriptional regulator